MDKSFRHYAEQKILNTKEYKLYGSVYVKVLEQAILMDGSRSWKVVTYRKRGKLN